MTAYDLLKSIGSAKDEYIMDARKRPKKKTPRWPFALAAAAVLALAAVGAWKYLIPGFRVNTAETASAESSAAAGEPAEDFAPSPAAEATAMQAPGEQPDAPPPGPPDAYQVTLLAGAEYPASIPFDDYEARSDNWTSNQVSEDVSQSFNAFSYRTASAILKDSTESGCYSPLSLYQTLAILASGAKGQTRQELLDLLGVSDADTLAEEAGKLYRVNYSDDGIDKMIISNSIWLDDTTETGEHIDFNQDWVLSAAADYYADVYGADFSQPETSEALGSWIAERTGNFLNPTPQDLGLGSETLMAVLNTVWYKTQWDEPFREENNTEDEFTPENGEPVTCTFMHRALTDGRYVDGDGYTKSYIDLYRGRMVFVLPDDGTDIDDLLTEERLWDIFEGGTYTDAEVHWSVPKFDTSVTYRELPQILQGLGVNEAFRESADFSSISDTPLMISVLQQGTHIAVSEDGVEAASYSIAGMKAGEAAPEEKPVVEMNLNRPFLYLITANDGSNAFIGVVRHPTE